MWGQADHHMGHIRYVVNMNTERQTHVPPTKTQRQDEIGLLFVRRLVSCEKLQEAAFLSSRDAAYSSVGKPTQHVSAAGAHAAELEHISSKGAVR